LTPDDYERLVQEPPVDRAAFIDAMLVAEGYDAGLADEQLRQWVSDAVDDWIFDDGRGRGSKSGLPLLPGGSGSI
jgi:hypothetical protein